MKSKVLTLLLLVVPLLNVLAQVPPTPDQGEEGPGPGAPSTPVDQYIYILPIIAALIVVYFVWSQRKFVKS